MAKIVSQLPATVRLIDLLEKEVCKNTIEVAFKFRISVILNGIRGMSNNRSARELATTVPTIKKWRSRWTESYEMLQRMEEDGVDQSGRPAKDHQLIKQIKAILTDLPRSGNPGRITMAQKEQIVALATQKPEDHSIPMTNWTHELLAHVAISKNIVDSITPRYVGIILKKRTATS